MPGPTSAVDPPYSRGEAGFSTFPSYDYGDDSISGTALTNAFQVFEFNDVRVNPDGSTNGKFLSTGIILANDHMANFIEFSFDGVTVRRIFAGETLNFGMRRERKIYLRGQAGGEDYRLLVW